MIYTFTKSNILTEKDVFNSHRLIWVLEKAYEASSNNQNTEGQGKENAEICGTEI